MQRERKRRRRREEGEEEEEEEAGRGRLAGSYKSYGKKRMERESKSGDHLRATGSVDGVGSGGRKQAVVESLWRGMLLDGGWRAVDRAVDGTVVEACWWTVVLLLWD